MRLDTQSLFSDTQKLSGASATGTNVLDIGKAAVLQNTSFSLLLVLIQIRMVASRSPFRDLLMVRHSLMLLRRRSLIPRPEPV